MKLQPHQPLQTRDSLSLACGYEYRELGTLTIELAKCSLKSYT